MAACSSDEREDLVVQEVGSRLVIESRGLPMWRRRGGLAPKPTDGSVPLWLAELAMGMCPAAAPGLRPARAGRARPFTVCIDTWALGAGYLSMGAGYEIWHDVLVGQAFFWLPVLIYEVARLLWQAPAGEPVAGTGRG